MIFVTVGSVAPFDSLIKRIDEIASQESLDITAQIGNGSYLPKNVKWFRFEKSLDPYFKAADLVITHNGAGTLFELLSLGKKIIAIPNPNTVQIKNMDIVTKLSEEGHILACLDVKMLAGVLHRAREWTPKGYVAPECRIADVIKDFLLGPA
ncbi:MAG: hypothetical protein LUP94_00635, partial [Candidatus Methanomethylicus sp.]|nr:hypothetical protein [Candidatus Methanomethylicus sp.]